MQSMYRVITHETRFVRGTRMRQLQRAHCRFYVLLRVSLVVALCYRTLLRETYRDILVHTVSKNTSTILTMH